MDQYQKQRKAYGYLCSVIMVIAIFHSLGQIMLQTFLKLNQDTSFTHAPTLCMLYGSSFFTAVLSSAKLNLEFVISLSSVLSLVMTIALIIFSSLAVKGKKLFVYLNLVFYALDTIFLLPLFFFLKTFPLPFTLFDLLFSLLLHLLFLGFDCYLAYLAYSLDKTERNSPTL
ncbi:MAG: hypothetical protein SOW65_01895 [Candidatus Enterosoma sp.]|nr:hypothetical protein [bacterium]MDY3210584.1 hypothetical protein [Candidatus Enterosoma sp.]MDY3264832.1 hypothetical protein [Candidatus Enterosoma sp.]